MVLSWYLLGPVTKFQNVGEKIEYEIAQQPILAFRVSGTSPLPEPGEFQVVCAKTHIADPNKPDDGLFLYFFPNCTLNVYGGGMSSFRVCPTEAPNITRMEFDYYHMESGEKFKEYYKFVRQVAMEDFELCEKAQDNLGRGVYSEGILNPEKENGVSFYQDRVFELVCQQHAADQIAEESVTSVTQEQDKGLERITAAA
ncbi:hypothetical protein APSETT445_005668 [Aspergillus pseudonomiae]